MWGLGYFAFSGNFSGISWWVCAACSCLLGHQKDFSTIASLHETFRNRDGFEHCAHLLGWAEGANMFRRKVGWRRNRISLTHTYAPVCAKPAWPCKPYFLRKSKIQKFSLTVESPKPGALLGVNDGSAGLILELCCAIMVSALRPIFCRLLSMGILMSISMLWRANLQGISGTQEIVATQEIVGPQEVGCVNPV